MIKIGNSNIPKLGTRIVGAILITVGIWWFVATPNKLAIVLYAIGNLLLAMGGD